MSDQQLLYLQDVTVSFDGFKALNELSLCIEKKELRCIIGPNGAGKSTMLDVITGKTRPNQGRVEFADQDLLKMSESQISQAGIGRKFQRPTIFPNHSVFENIYIALETNRSIWWNLFHRISRAEKQAIHDILKITGLTDHKHKPAQILSHGQKQWLEIGMLLVQKPQLILLDEPVAGMTNQEIEKTIELLHTLSSDHTLVVIEHDMEFVRAIAQKISVLHEGQVIAEGDINLIQNDPKVKAIYLGE